MYNNQRTQRAILHRQLVDTDDKPCLCGSRDRREIHRIIPGELGGEYLGGNIQVLCFDCHHKAHPNSKFMIGDIVALNGRTPDRIELARHRPRTIIDIKYNSQRRCNYYLVGSNGQGNNDGNGNPLEGYTAYWFRSYMLMPYTPRRYHFIRQYTRRTK